MLWLFRRSRHPTINDIQFTLCKLTPPRQIKSTAGCLSFGSVSNNVIQTLGILKNRVVSRHADRRKIIAVTPTNSPHRRLRSVAALGPHHGWPCGSFPFVQLGKWYTIEHPWHHPMPRRLVDIVVLPTLLRWDPSE